MYTRAPARLSAAETITSSRIGLLFPGCGRRNPTLARGCLQRARDESRHRDERRRDDGGGENDVPGPVVPAERLRKHEVRDRDGERDQKDLSGAHWRVLAHSRATRPCPRSLSSGSEAPSRPPAARRARSNDCRSRSGGASLLPSPLSTLARGRTAGQGLADRRRGPAAVRGRRRASRRLPSCGLEAPACGGCQATPPPFARLWRAQRGPTGTVGRRPGAVGRRPVTD